MDESDIKVIGGEKKRITTLMSAGYTIEEGHYINVCALKRV